MINSQFILALLILFSYPLNHACCSSIVWMDWKELNSEIQNSLQEYYKEADALQKQTRETDAGHMTTGKEETAVQILNNLQNVPNLEFKSDPSRFAYIGSMILGTIGQNEVTGIVVIWNSINSGRCGANLCGLEVLRIMMSNGKIEFTPLLEKLCNGEKDSIEITGKYNGMIEISIHAQRYRWDGKKYRAI